jgi:transcription antitermination factor NusG
MWFAIMAHPRREQDASREVKSLGLVTFYPWIRVRKNRRQGKQVVTQWLAEPYYPRYLFADCLLDDVHRVNDIRYVSRVVSFGGKPASIPAPVMSVIMAGANSEGLMGSKDQVSRARFEAAEKVSFVSESPLRDVIARILKDDGGTDVQVLVMMMGSEREMTVPASSLKQAA